VGGGSAKSGLKPGVKTAPGICLLPVFSPLMRALFALVIFQVGSCIFCLGLARTSILSTYAS
jgi:hypothetical protein